jgi:hypothetical protein
VFLVKGCGNCCVVCHLSNVLVVINSV